jgi:hypothetical protein
MADNVVFLEFKSPHMADDMMSFVCCGHCRNKTFTLTEDRADSFPLMKCAACGQHMGRMGWAHDDLPDKRGEA